MDYKKHFKSLGFRPRYGPESTTVGKLERLIGVPVPTPYREYLLQVGGGYLDALVPYTGVTPRGTMQDVRELFGVGWVVDLLDSDVTPRNMICVGLGNDGVTICLSIAGLDHGQVFALDTKMRYYWDQEILSGLPDLAPEIREFFRQRDAQELPDRPWGYENCYHIANSFPDFVKKIRIWEPE